MVFRIRDISFTWRAEGWGESALSLCHPPPAAPPSLAPSDLVSDVVPQLHQNLVEEGELGDQRLGLLACQGPGRGGSELGQPWPPLGNGPAPARAAHPPPRLAPPAPGTEDSGAGGCRSRGPPPHLGPLPPPRASSPRMEWSALVTGEEGETRSESRDVARGLAGKGKEKGQGQTARVSEQRRLAGRQEEGGHGEPRGEGELPQPLTVKAPTPLVPGLDSDRRDPRKGPQRRARAPRPPTSFPPRCYAKSPFFETPGSNGILFR